jgi:phosphatidylglycerophosphatase A
MGRFHRLISTCLGIGYTPKGGGTVAAVAACIAWYLAGTGGNESLFIEVAVTVVILVIGTWSADKVEAEWGKDSSRVVIDEVAGMCISLVAVPIRWQYVLIGLALFRAFDIIKPLYIRRLEKLKGGWGVMLDDVLAGIYSNLVLQLIVLMKIWKG